jgi:uncharacterized membrane protein
MTTEKIRVSASSVMSSVADVRPTPASWRGETPARTADDEDTEVIEEPVYSGILYGVLLRRAFLIGSVAWAAVIPLAAFAASRPDATSLVYGFAAAAYTIGHLICHQLPARSFHLWGAALPVCARCSGIYAAAALAALAFSVRRGPEDTARGIAVARRVLLLALLPTAATVLFEWTTGVMPANWIRALAGVPLGVAVAWAIGMVN